MAEIVLTEKNFEQEVLSCSQTVLVDFWAGWCGPCRMLAPIIAQLAEDHPEVKVGKVNVDENPELANDFRIASIPTILIFKNGKLAQTSIGYCSKESLESLLV